MSNKINFKITSPERVVYSDQVDEIILPTPMGEIGILPNHIPLVSLLSPGEIRIKKGDEEIFMAVSGGFIEVQPNKVTVLADTAEHAEEIDEKQAEAAHQKALGMLKEKKVDSVEFAAISSRIEKEISRLKVVRKKRRRKEPPVLR